MIPVFTMVGELIKEWLVGISEIRKSKIETKKAEQANKTRLLLDTNSYNRSWEMAALSGSDIFIKRFSFLCFTAPFIIAMISPAAVKNYFTVAISTIPDWYKATYMAITGSVWGVSALKDPVSQIISYFKNK